MAVNSLKTWKAESLIGPARERCGYAVFDFRPSCLKRALDFFTNDDDPAEEWTMFSLVSDSESSPRMWGAQEGETLDSWRDYFEEL